MEITPHALKRFRERYLLEETCGRELAMELLMMAYLESKPPPKYVRRKCFGINSLHMRVRVSLYHKYSGLVLICGSGDQYPHVILTVIPCPFPPETVNG